MLLQLLNPATNVIDMLTGKSLVFGNKRVTLSNLVARNASHCRRYHNRPLFRHPRPDAAVHAFRETLILFLAAGPDEDMQAVQINEVKLTPEQTLFGCGNICRYLGIARNQSFSATLQGDELTLALIPPPLVLLEFR